MINTKSNKMLFLITKTYPFGHGEQYITKELEYLSLVFNKIIIYPNDYFNKDTNHSKELPVNVEVLNFNQKLSSGNKSSFGDYFYLLKHTIREFFLTDDKVNFFRNFKWNLINFWTQFQIAKELSKYFIQNNFSTNNVLFYSYWFHKSAILLSILKERKEIGSFVSRAHSIDLYHNKWGIINETVKVPPFKMFKLNNTEKIITISQHGSNFLKDHFPRHKDKITNFLLGIDLINDKNTNKTEYPFLIVTCSHIDDCKRLYLLAEGLTKVDKKVKWVHFGGGVKEEEAKILKFFNNKELDIEVELRGYAENKVVHQFYQDNRVNLFVNLSTVEGIPVSIMEAMGYSIPVMATKVYGTPEAVFDTKNGFLLDVNFSKDELVSKLIFCIENKELLLEMGKASKEIYLEKFNAEKNYTQFANYLASL